MNFFLNNWWLGTSACPWLSAFCHPDWLLLSSITESFFQQFSAAPGRSVSWDQNMGGGINCGGREQKVHLDHENSSRFFWVWLVQVDPCCLIWVSFHTGVHGCPSLLPDCLWFCSSTCYFPLPFASRCCILSLLTTFSKILTQNMPLLLPLTRFSAGVLFFPLGGEVAWSWHHHAKSTPGIRPRLEEFSLSLCFWGGLHRGGPFSCGICVEFVIQSPVAGFWKEMLWAVTEEN